MLTESELSALKKKYFPRVPWTEAGPVRRKYRVRAADGGSAAEALVGLAVQERFVAPGQSAVTGDADVCLEAFYGKSMGEPIGMIFGTETAAFWSDISLGAPDEEGWQPMIVRSEEGENLTALAHEAGILRFRRF